MNTLELLEDLKSKEWCDGINGVPELQEVKSDGGRWYIINIREVQGGNVVIVKVRQSNRVKDAASDDSGTSTAAE